MQNRLSIPALSPDLIGVIGNFLPLHDKITCYTSAKLFSTIHRKTSIVDFQIDGTIDQTLIYEIITRKLDCILKIIPDVKGLRLLLNDLIDSHILCVISHILCKWKYRHLTLHIVVSSDDTSYWTKALTCFHRVYRRVLSIDFNCMKIDYNNISDLNRIVNEYPYSFIHTQCNVLGLRVLGQSTMPPNVGFLSVYAYEFSYIMFSDNFTNTNMHVNCIIDDPYVQCNKPDLLTNIEFTQYFWKSYQNKIVLQEWIHSWFTKQNLQKLASIEMCFDIVNTSVIHFPIMRQIPDNLRIYIYCNVCDHSLWNILTLTKWLICSHQKVILYAPCNEIFIKTRILKLILGRNLNITILNNLSYQDMDLEYETLPNLLLKCNDNVFKFFVSLLKEHK
jgi:hypothetical protein